MQRSRRPARGRRPPARAARNFDGTVSRFLASSVCSKVPCEGQGAWVRRGRSVDPRWRSGRSPATPDRLRIGKVPHFVPLCNTNRDLRPTLASPRSGRGRESGVFAAGSAVGRNDLRLAARLHGLCAGAAAMHAVLRARVRAGRNPTGRGDTRVSAGTSAAATSSSTAGTSRSATTSWIFGAALAACSERRAARRERASAAWAASVSRVGRRGARLGCSAAISAGMPSAGQRGCEVVERLLGRLAELRRGRRRGAARARACRGGGARPRRARGAARGRRRRRRAAGRARRAARRRSLALGAARVCAGRSSGARNPAAGASEQDRRPEPPGRGGDERERDEAADEREPGLRARRSRATGRRGRRRRSARRARAADRCPSLAPERAATSAADAAPPPPRAPEREQLGERDRSRRAGEAGARHGRGGHRVTARDRRRTATIARPGTATASSVSQAEIGFASRRAMKPGLAELGEHGGARAACRARAGR